MARRILSFVLCIVMIVGIFPASSAEGVEESPSVDQFAFGEFSEMHIDEPEEIPAAEVQKPAIDNEEPIADEETAVNAPAILEESADEFTNESAPETGTEPVAETETQTAPETELAEETETVPETESRAESETEPEAEPAAESETEQTATESSGTEAVKEEASSFVIDGETLIAYTGEDEEVMIPEGIRIIGENAFKDSRKLRQVVLSNSVETIGKSAFEGCSNLKKVVVQEGSRLERIEENAFKGANKLDRFFAEKIANVAESAFDAEDEHVAAEPAGEDIENSGEENKADEPAGEENAVEESAAEKAETEETAVEEAATEDNQAEETAIEEAEFEEAVIEEEESEAVAIEETEVEETEIEEAAIEEAVVDETMDEYETAEASEEIADEMYAVEDVAIETADAIESMLPVFILQPMSAEAAAGATVSFTVDAGEGVSYQWQVSFDNGETWDDIDWTDSTASMLELTVHAGMAGMLFRALATNEYGTTISETAGVTITETLLSDGNWLYRVIDGYAEVAGYLDKTAVSLSVPDQLGGYFVNAIGENAFADLAALSALKVHGNVVRISDKVFAGKEVTLSGYNGTGILAWARENGYPYENLTYNAYFDFRDEVIDYGYADTGRYEYIDSHTLRMRPAEAAQLAIGSIFYEPVMFESMPVIYKVTGLQGQGDWVYISVTEAGAEESLDAFTFRDDNMYADWSRAEWAPGVTASREKVPLGFNIDATGNPIDVKYEIPLANKLSWDGMGRAYQNDFLKFFVEGKIDIKGHASVDYRFHVLSESELKEASFYIEPTATIKLGFKLSGSNTKAHTDVRMGIYGDPQEAEIYFCSVPVVSAAKIVEARVALYFKISASGEVSITTKGSGKLGIKWNTSAKKFEGINTWSFTPPTLSGAINITAGPALALEIDAAILGKLCSVEFFAGVVADFNVDWTLLGGTVSHDFVNDTDARSRANDAVCFNLKADFKISATAKLDCELFKKALGPGKLTGSRGWSFELFAFKKKIGEWHYELGKGTVKTCSYSNKVRVDFDPGTGESVQSQELISGSKVVEPKLKKTNGTLKGWYIQEKKKLADNPWDFAKDTVSNNITLKAVWELPQGAHTVTYKCNYEHDDFQAVAQKGEKLQEPDPLKRLDYRFDGWYKEKALTTKWDFNADTMPDNDITLYAKWIQEDGYDPFAEEYINKQGQGNVVFPETGHSYTHIMEYKSYEEAVAHAKRLGGYLATINSAAEQEFLRQYLYQDCAQTYLWLGMVSQDDWKHWATGEKVTYTNWSSKPQTSSSQYNAVLIRSSGEWTTLSNDKTAHYVIEWGAPDTDSNYNSQKKSDVRYTSDDKTQTSYVAGLNNDTENVVIDGWYNGYRVVGISDEAFKGNTTIRTVVIPATITSIGKKAFQNCTALETIELTDAVTQMGENVFQGCTHLTKVKWSAGLKTIPAYTFDGDVILNEITNTGKVNRVENRAFYNCSSLTGGIPANAVYIGNYAYYNSGLNAIQLPGTITSIGSYAFQNCKNAATISLSEKMTSIPSSAFYGCAKVNKVYIPKSINSISSNAFYNVNATFHVYKGTYAETWCNSNKKNMYILDGQYRVSYSPGVSNTQGTGTKTDEMINEAYVRTGTRLTEPGISVEGKTLEGWYLDPEFTQPWSFSRDVMPDYDITLYAKWTDNANLYDFDVINGEARITRYLGKAETISIPETISNYPVTGIAAESIESQQAVYLSIPRTVVSIEGGAFNCPNLREITCQGEDYYKVGNDGVLYNKEGTCLVYAPQGITLTSYTVPETVTKILDRAFIGQTALASLHIPDTVTEIEGNILEGNRFATVYGSEDSASPACAFANQYNYSYNVYTVSYYNESILIYTARIAAGQLIEDYFKPVDDFSTFGGWYRDAALTDKWVFKTDRMPASDLNLYLKWETQFGVSVNDGEITITGYQGTAKAVVIPEELMGYPVTGIAKGALTKTTITSVTIPSCVKDIAPGAISSSAKIIGDKGSVAQEYATTYGLTFAKRKYTIHFDSAGGSEVADIKVAYGSKPTLVAPVRSNYIFIGWYEDTSYSDEVRWDNNTKMVASDVTLYAYWKNANTNVSNDFSYALLDDGTVEITNYNGSKVALTIPSRLNGYTVSRIGAYAFADNDSVLTVTIPASVTSVGEYAFANSAVQSVKGAKQLVSIEESAFMNAGALQSFYFSATLRSIGDSAFMYCVSLSEITLRKGLESIGSKAFYGCEFLRSVALPITLKQIGREAFGQCWHLTAISAPGNLSNVISEAVDSDVKVSFKDSETISILKISNGPGKKVSMTWNKVANAAKYNVYRKRETDTSFKKLSTEYTATEATITGNPVGTTELFYVQALDSEGTVLCRSEETSVYMSPIENPEVISVTQKNANAAVMKLGAVEDAAGYIIERADSAAGPFTKLKTTTAVSFTNSGLVPGHDYYYRVKAYQTVDGEKTYSNYSDVYHFHMPYKYLTAPQNVSAIQTGLKALDLTWDTVEDAEGYHVYRKGNGTEYELAGTTLREEFTDSSAASGQKYSYRIAAFFAENGEIVEGKLSGTVSLTMMKIPTPVIQEAIQKQSGSITVSWSQVADAEGYSLERAEEQGEYAVIKTVSKTAYTDEGVSVGTTYTYRVRAYRTVSGVTEYSLYSPAVEYKMPKVASVTSVKAVKNGGTSAKVTWKKLNNVSGYEVWLSANNVNNFVLTATGTETSAVLEELHDGVTYYVKVRAFIEENQKTEYGEFSETSAVTIIGTPVIEIAEQFGTKSARLIWSKVESADGYEVWRKVAGESSYSRIRTLDVNNLINTWLTIGVKHSYKVRAYRKTDDGIAYGSFSGAKTVLPLAVPVLNPIVRASSTKVTVSWSAVEAATGYVLYMSNEEKGVYTEAATTEAPKYSVTGLTVGETYYFKVIPYVTIGGQNQPGKESAARGLLLMATPKVTAVEKSGENQLAITWNPIDGATKYIISYGTAADALTSSKTTTNTTVKLSYLEQNTRYYYSIRAYSKVLDDECSSLASTTKNYYLSDLGRAGIKSFAQTSSTALTITWGEVEGAEGYELFRTDAEDGAYTLVKRQAATSFTEKELTEGGTYYYKVRAYKTIDSARVYGRYSAIRMIKMVNAVTITSAQIISNKAIEIQWDAMNDAVKYNVYRSVNGEAYTLLKAVTTTNYTDSTCTSFNKYTYRVEAVLKPSVTQTAPKSSAKSCYFGALAAVKISKLTQPDTGSVKITWKAVSGATGYQIYAAEGTNGTMKRMLTTAENSGTVTGLNGGSVYRFMVRAYAKVDETNYYGPFSAEQSRDIFAAPTDVKLVETVENGITLTWNAVNGATSYQVWRKTASDTDFVKVKTFTDGTTSYTKTGLEKGATYSYKVRALRATDAGTDITWSGIKKIKIISIPATEYPECSHNYTNNMNESWTYTISGASALALTFSSSTCFEANYDKLYITDKDGNVVGNEWYSGTTLAGKTIIVPGNTVNLRMTSDGSQVRYGFSFDSILPAAK